MFLGDLIVSFKCRKGTYKKDGERLLAKVCVDRQGVTVLYWKRVD